MSAAERARRWRWLVESAHPLTARVTVNRLWPMYFGTGIVKPRRMSACKGEPPVHPELLDWLATGFVRTGCDIRRRNGRS